MLSFRGRSWNCPAFHHDGFSGSDLVSAILTRRGFAEGSPERQRFLSPSIATELQSRQDTLPGLHPAVSRLELAVTSNEIVGIVGDYDVDGATSAALMLRWLRLSGVRTHLYVPDRLSEGYGANAAAMRHLHAAGATLVVCVDNGTLAFDALADAQDRGLDVIVIDHHAPLRRDDGELDLPSATAIINPHLVPDDPFGILCAAGIVWITLLTLNNRLAQSGFFNNTRPQPSMAALLDLVALGTIADVVPLTGINRALVTSGLKAQNQMLNAGIAAMSHLSGVPPLFDAFHSGFVFGPRINAAGRIGDCSLGAHLLATDDPDEARTIAARLEALNAERKTLCDEAQEQAAAMAQAEDEQQIKNGAPPPPAIVLASKEWHPGIIGIVAGRIKERFNRPCFIFSINTEQRVAKGSGRSIPGFNLGAAVHHATSSGLGTGGGHAMAAGITVPIDNLERFREFLCQRCSGLASPSIQVDLSIDAGTLTADAVRHMHDTLSPFGQGNREPLLMVPNVRVDFLSERRKGTLHLKGTTTGGTIHATAFGASGTPLGNALFKYAGGKVDLLVHASINTWRGACTVDLMLQDAREASGQREVIRPRSSFGPQPQGHAETR